MLGCKDKFLESSFLFLRFPWYDLEEDKETGMQFISFSLSIKLLWILTFCVINLKWLCGYFLLGLNMSSCNREIISGVLL